MKKTIETAKGGCGTRLGIISCAAALFLALISSQDSVAAETYGGYGDANLTKVTGSVKSPDTIRLLDLDTIKVVDGSGKEGFRWKSLVEIDSLIQDYKNQYLDNLSEDEIRILVWETLKNNEEIRGVLDDMLKDEDVIKAIKLGDNETIGKKFIELIGIKSPEAEAGKILGNCIIILLGVFCYLMIRIR